MEKNKKLVILIIFTIVAVIVWWPKGRKKALVLPKGAVVSINKAMPEITPVQKKRSEFTDWGRNPFVWSKEATDTVTDLTLSGIIWDNEASYAIINGEVVHTGDTIAGRTVKRIEPNKIIITDGTQDYILELK